MLLFISKVGESNQNRYLRKRANRVQFWNDFKGLKNIELKKVFLYTQIYIRFIRNYFFFRYKLLTIIKKIIFVAEDRRRHIKTVQTLWRSCTLGK